MRDSFRVLTNSKNDRRRGLTLIELLTVITIIGTMTAISVPAVVSARHQAKSFECTTHLREMVYALHLYAQTHNGRMPFHTGDGDLTEKEQSAMYALLPYCEKDETVFHCPCDVGSLENSMPLHESFGTSYKLEGRAPSERGQPERTVKEWDTKKGVWKNSVKKAKPQFIRTLSQHIYGADAKKLAEGKALKLEERIGMEFIPFAKDFVEPWKAGETKSSPLRGLYTAQPFHGQCMNVVFVAGQIESVESEEDWNRLKGKPLNSKDD